MIAENRKYTSRKHLATLSLDSEEYIEQVIIIVKKNHDMMVNPETRETYDKLIQLKQEKPRKQTDYLATFRYLEAITPIDELSQVRKLLGIILPESQSDIGARMVRYHLLPQLSEP